MSFLFLLNTAGEQANGTSTLSLGTGTASGYDIEDMVNGARSTCYRSDASSGEIGVGYTFAADTDISHCVIAGADWLLTEYGLRIRGKERDSGGTWSNISGFDTNPITAGALIGAYAQDYVMAITQSVKRGVGISAQTKGVGSEAMQFSKLYFSNSFSFSHNPKWGFSVELIPTNSAGFKPLHAYMEYETERRWSLTWDWITLAELQAFNELPNILAHPFFLYDSAGDVFPWYLEHVVIESWTEAMLAPGYFQIEIVFRRLKHYGHSI
jgi:hypothetical protein